MYWIIILIIIIVLLTHHIIMHPQYGFPDRAFQIHDVLNHETWIVASIAFGMGMYMC